VPYTDPALKVDSFGAPPDMRYSNDTREQEARLTPGIVDLNTGTLHSVYNRSPQLGSSLARLSTESGPFLLSAGDFDLLPAFQNAIQLPDVVTSDHFLESELTGSFPNSPPALNHDAAMASFDHSPIGEDDVPTSADYRRSLDPPEPEPNALEWMETNQGM
jgi:hypothetical protein